MTLPPSYAPTERTRVRRLAQRGSYDRALVHSILDEALVCHVGYVLDGHPFVIPTAFVRVGESVYLHGAVANRTLGALAAPNAICITVTLLDGLVLARSAFHHSMNYRSVVALGQAREVLDDAEKREVLDALVDRLAPGRARVVRAPNEKELRVTRVLALDLVEVSAKTRGGPPLDDDEDLSQECWAGVVPMTLVLGEPISDEREIGGALSPVP
jgi:nitroimidazol reductase NimA-like FMN-containing flavoprotein (pyridoxamine 5'-phosphate oxidase superfamily)